MPVSEERISIGVVQTVNPARRQLRVNPSSGCAHAFEGLQWVRVASREGAEWRCRVLDIRQNEKNIVVGLTAGVTRDSVAKMKGASIVLLPGENRPPRADEYRARQLLGLPVAMPSGDILGTVTGYLETKSNDVLEVEKPEGGIVLIPAIAEVIRAVNWDAGRIEVGEIAPFVVDEEGESAAQWA